jgi:tetratricopeptide (TPR) repeat protein
MMKLVIVAIFAFWLVIGTSAQMTVEQRVQLRDEIKSASSDAYQALRDEEFELALQHANRGLALIEPGYRTHEDWRVRLLTADEPWLYYYKAEALLGLGRREEALEAYRMTVSWEQQRSVEKAGVWDLNGHILFKLRYAKALAEAGRLNDAVATYYAALRSDGMNGSALAKLPYRVVFHPCEEGLVVPLKTENVINASNLMLTSSEMLPTWERERVYGENLFGILYGRRQTDPEHGKDYEIPDALFPGLPYIHMRVATHTQRPSHYGFSMALTLVRHEEDRQAINDAVAYFANQKIRASSRPPFHRDVHEWQRWATDVRRSMPILEEHRQMLEDDPERVNRLAGRVEAPN